jgi:uncharacterized lipoprotein YddW (UPF0748 family)
MSWKMLPNRRTFLQTLGMSALALGKRDFVSAAAAVYRNPRGDRMKNWVWITIDPDKSAGDWKRSFALMRESGVQAILPEIYNGKQAYFASHRLPVMKDLLGIMLPLAKAEGLEVHAWMWCMPCMVPEIMEKHPDWYNVNARGESALDKPAYVDYYKFLDPGRPEVREWVRGTVQELASIPELTGIHLDYIRHPDAILPKGLWKKYNIIQDKVYPQYDYGYSQYERKEFQKKYGADPLALKDSSLEEPWFQFQLDMVVDLVNQYLVPAAHAKRKIITAAVFPGPTLARQMVRQDWGRFDLDAFLPMLYNVFYETGPEWVKQETQEGVSTVTKPLYSGLFVHEMNAVEFSRTVQAALEGGASGVSIFSADAMDQSKWDALKKINNSKGHP